ncbi:hypothetical protein [Ramlibacter sp.]|uniref:hypothetical protein n=1 Tax=Ramlibacter sp. TaxID=1917967 RepID=UPI00262FDEF0|nr:hypothetical protein [Ramlibacter sp.]
MVSGNVTCQAVGLKLEFQPQVYDRTWRSRGCSGRFVCYRTDAHRSVMHAAQHAPIPGHNRDALIVRRKHKVGCVFAVRLPRRTFVQQRASA